MLPQANLAFIGATARFEHAPRNSCYKLIAPHIHVWYICYSAVGTVRRVVISFRYTGMAYFLCSA